MSADKTNKNTKSKSLAAPDLPATPAETSPPATFPIVGIGTSAGGLAAFEAFFSGMPTDADPNMAFVLVQHLAPDHKSILTQIIQHHTRMPVFEVEDGMTVRPNCVYIIPPNRDMAYRHGKLHLLEPVTPHGSRLAIDFFFRSLADDQRERAICVVLSGTGSDGTQGLRAIKGAGGMAIAQRLDTAEYDGMPRSAIATGLVDYELSPAEMPAQLIAYVEYAFARHARPATPLAPRIENALGRIFLLISAQTGHDFSLYKPSTITRRIERRMAIHQIERIDDYVKYLQQVPAEVEALFRDLLIGVTSFFRDPTAFQVLENQIIPQLLRGKPAGSLIRIWTPGCSTGEEAYSIAILLLERLEALKLNYSFQLFATDIDRQAIAVARAGIYPASIAADLTPERLARYFTAEPDGSAYRIHKGVRDLLVFSEQNVLKDPPFSRIDLISCRNLMIYLGAELQQKLMALFHYALNPGGMLFLGTSETVGEFAEQFAVLDRQAKLYLRKDHIHGHQRAARVRLLAPTTTLATPLPRTAARPAFPAKLPLRELTEQTLLRQLAPAGALVNNKGDILYLHGRTGMYLELPAGETGINNILKLAREGLRRDLGTALNKATESQEVVRRPGLRVKTNDHFSTVNLSVCPVATDPAVATAALYLVILEEVTVVEPRAQLPGNADDAATAGGAEMADLKQELRAQAGYLQNANEELKAANEDLESLNQEMQSVNEELQSTNEELETSKEELQSINEELTTVNAELQTKVLDLSRANNDMNNLLAGTGVGTIFVDHQLRILRFTAEASTIINLIPSDEGRPVAHLVSNLVGYHRLVADVQAVLDTLIPYKVDVQTLAGKWYTMRIQPYRTLDNVIEGAVITFVDTTEVVQTRAALQAAKAALRLAVVVRDAHDAITVQDLEGRILAWNPGAVRMYGWSEGEALLMNVRELIPPGLREDALAKVHQLSRADTLEPFRTQRINKHAAVMEVWMTASALVNAAGQMYAIATTERKIEPTTDRTGEAPDGRNQ